MKHAISALVAGVGLTASLAAGAADGEWQQELMIYGMGAALDGDAQVGPVKVPVNLSIGDVFDALEMGAMAAYRADNGTWSVTGDLAYMGLGGHQKTQRGLVKGDVGIDQTSFMVTVGRHLGENFQVLGSLSYFDLSTRLKVTTTAPITGDKTVRKANTSANWVDPMIGVLYGLPLAEGWRLNLRGDIGGFGIGSDLAYQVFPNVQWQASDKLGVVVGYRVIGFDYKEGSGAHYQHYDLVEQGPLLGMTLAF